MLRVEAIVRPSRFDEVKSALDDIGIVGISVMEIKGAGRQKGFVQHYRGSEYKVNLLPKVMVVLVIKDADLDKVLDTIESAARTGDVGDGKIFVTPVLDAVRIRTGDRGEIALS